MFSAVEKPRTHYDVEVITKLVVYAGKSYAGISKQVAHVSNFISGIAWLAVEGNLILFRWLGLV